MYIKRHYPEVILENIRKLKKNIVKYHILIIYNFLFAVITTKFYQKTCNYQVKSRPSKVKEFRSPLVNCC